MSEELKPPLGIMPEWRWKELRALELIACLHRYAAAEEAGIHSAPEKLEEWAEELARHTHSLAVHKAEQRMKQRLLGRKAEEAGE